MQRFARWHIWLGWAAALPLLVWTISGLVMTLRPIEDVRGTTLKIESPPRAVTVALNGGDQATMIAEGRILNQRGRSVLIATYLDGSTGRIELASGGSHPLPPADEAEARRTVAEGIKGGKSATSARLFDAANPPPRFRQEDRRLASNAGGRHARLRRAQYGRDRGGAHTLVAVLRCLLGAAHHGPGGTRGHLAPAAVDLLGAGAGVKPAWHSAAFPAAARAQQVTAHTRRDTVRRNCRKGSSTCAHF
jgi:hypothetical protein